MSLTLIKNESREPASVPLWQVTSVTPSGKKEPDAGLQVIVPHVPLTVGAG